MVVYEVKLITTVSDPKALWRKAADYLLVTKSVTSIVELRELIGTKARPDISNCLAMLLDRNEYLDGAEIDHHVVDVVTI
jgi:hypothetical protein